MTHDVKLVIKRGFNSVRKHQSKNTVLKTSTNKLYLCEHLVHVINLKKITLLPCIFVLNDCHSKHNTYKLILSVDYNNLTQKICR